MANETIRKISSSTDMWTNYVDDGWTYSGSIVLGYSSTLSSKIRMAIRFPNIVIPKGSSISTADLHFIGNRDGSESVKGKIYGVDEDNTPSWGSHPFGRTKTSAFNTGSTTGTDLTMDVSSIMEEIVGRSGWASGNAIGFVVEDNGTTTSSGTQRLDDNNVRNETYLHYRVSAEPNFKPTPVSVSAPSLPTAEDVGMKFSEPGVSVLTATDDECFLTTRKNTVKLVAEDFYTSTAAEIVSVSHSLGYKPFVTVYAQEVAGDWRKIPRGNASVNRPYYFVDSSNLYLNSSASGQKFYYRIFLDRIV